MRPTHKNRNRNRHRSGGGGNNGGGGGNPLSRVYESNGPDVKVRGTAQTVADKYLQLGRDAQSSGDIVMAESYFQHAEHYLRIVFAAQAYNQQAQQQYRRPDEDFDDDESEEGAEAQVEQRGQTQPLSDPDGTGDQPLIEANERPQQSQPQHQQNYRQQRDYGTTGTTAIRVSTATAMTRIAASRIAASRTASPSVPRPAALQAALAGPPQRQSAG